MVSTSLPFHSYCIVHNTCNFIFTANKAGINVAWICKTLKMLYVTLPISFIKHETVSNRNHRCLLFLVVHSCIWNRHPQVRAHQVCYWDSDKMYTFYLGNEIEWKHPKSVDLTGVEFKALASGSHTITRDFM